jgi:hypothetical protein
MRRLMLKFWQDDGGALIATEWLFIAVIMVIGIIVGLVFVRNAVVSELVEFGYAVESLNPSYQFDGVLGCGGKEFTAGSSFTYTPNFLANHPVQVPPTQPQFSSFDLCAN